MAGDSEFVVIDISDLRKLHDKALDEMSEQLGVCQSLASARDGVLGEAASLLAIKKREAARNASMIIDFILKHGQPIPQSSRADIAALGEDAAVEIMAYAVRKEYGALDKKHGFTCLRNIRERIADEQRIAYRALMRAITTTPETESK